jgi:hypothetical protein
MRKLFGRLTSDGRTGCKQSRADSRGRAGWSQCSRATLIYKMLAAEMPERYRERQEVDAKVGGAGGGPVSIEVTFVKPQSSE